MKIALEGIPEQIISPPPGIVSATIDKQNGKLSEGGDGSRLEYFIKGSEPKERAVHETRATPMDNGQQEELF